MEDTSGSFSDGDGNYLANSACQFRIISSAPIVLDFDSLNLEQNYDFIKVYDGTTDQSPMVAAVTGTAAQPITSSGSLFIVFTSDGSVQNSGFVATYTPINRRRPAVPLIEVETSTWPIATTVAVVALALISIALFATFRAYKIREKKKRKASGGIQTTISHPGATSSRARLAQFVASFQSSDSVAGAEVTSTEADLQQDPYDEARRKGGSVVWT